MDVRELDNYMIVFEEYEKILRMEGTQSRLEMETERSDETRNFKEELKKKRQQRNFHDTNFYNSDNILTNGSLSVHIRIRCKRIC